MTKADTARLAPFAYSPRSIGRIEVTPLGLGAMPLSFENKADDVENTRATVAAALDSGITLIDTADIYAPAWNKVGHNERQVADALEAYGAAHPDFDRANIAVATKGGITRAEGEKWGRDSSVGHFRTAVVRSKTNLGVEKIDLYYLHRPDRTRLYSEAIETLAVLKDEGHVKNIGISNASVEEIEIALEVLGEGNLAAVQNEFSPRFNHTSWDELQFCGEHGITFVPWSPLGGTGGGAAEVGGRFPAVAEVARLHSVSPQQVVLAWEMSLGDHVLPIPGASRPASIADSAKAMGFALETGEKDALDRELLPKR
ncbi:aldo/keto reductase [Dermabacter sp. p3-SID358]|uniref:aldo/keto reductase n=1 Tax=Dermabacter sp. p3-SID358 TaxID=2916114 RepID=UPI0021A75D9F|nr:aldo/keto reductase [Dermabacter sp. p3-SID358]MCT1867086.1 aldo/keto reductase [Dermabacter sp. p3-SID358]